MPNASRSKSLRACASLTLVFLATFLGTASASAQSLQTIAGGLIGDGATPANASLNFATDIVLDASGNLYIADQNNHRVRKVTPAGVVSTYAGTGLSGSTGDGGPASQAKLNRPAGVAVDSVGNVYIAERGGNRIRKVTPGGTISTVAGDGSSEILTSPTNVAVASNGTVYVTEFGTNRVKKIVGGVVSPFAGDGTSGYSGDGGDATAAQFRNPGGLLVAPDGSVLIADQSNDAVRRVDTTGTISTFASVSQPTALATNAAGELYASSYCNVYKINSSGTGDRIIGTEYCELSFGGDGGPQELASLSNVTAIAIAADGRIYINDSYNERVRVANAGTVATFVGPGASGEGSTAIGARVSHPSGMAYDSAGNLYVSERFLHRIRKITPGGVISTFAGNGNPGFSGDGGPAIAASFNDPRGLAFDQSGNLLVADFLNFRIRSISPGGTITTIAGNGVFATTGDNGPATAAAVGQPDQIAVNAAGDIFFGQNARLRRIHQGIISTFAGGGSPGQDGVPATSVTLGRPGQIGFDAAGRVYFTDSTRQNVRRIDQAGIITTVAGSPSGGGGTSGDGGPATSALVSVPHGLVVYPNGDFMIGDSSARIRKVTAGNIATVAGTGTAGFSGDGPALSSLIEPAGALALAPGGGVVLTESSNSRVRKLDIADPPQGPALSISDQSVTEGNSGTKTLTFTVSLSQAAASTVTFDIATSNGSATSGSDYVALALTGQTIAAGVTSKTFAVTVNGDAVYEPDEIFTLTLSNVSGANPADVVGVGTIVNDDSVPPTLSIGDVTVSEGNSGTKTATFTVTLSSAQTVPVFFDAQTADGTASSSSDYIAKTVTSQRIVVGSTSKTVTVTINGDTTLELDETFTVNLYNPVGATIADAQAVGTISNDDGSIPVPSLSIGDVTITEDPVFRSAIFTISLSAPTLVDVSFDVNSSDGSATVADNDYSPISGTVVIPAGSTSDIVVVAINDDFTVEADETFSVTLSNATNATIADGQAVGTIVNDDAGSAPTISISDSSVQEGPGGLEMSFTVALSHTTTHSVGFQFGTSQGTALSNYDYQDRYGGASIGAGSTTTTITIPVNDDALKESDEYFNITIANADYAIIDRAVAQGLIHDDGDTDPLPQLRLSTYGINSEGNSAQTSAVFFVDLAQPASTDVTFNIATGDGTAAAPGDYVAQAINGVVIPAGSTRFALFVMINGDTTFESDEIFNVNVTNVSGATLVDGTESFTILNDDAAPILPALSIGDVSISEGNSGTKLATFTVSLSAASASAVSFDIATANGTATAGSDYVAASLIGQSIAAGQDSKTFSITINGDTAVEADETFTVNVSNVSGATVGDGSATGMITNDDSAGGPTLSIGDVTISEGNSLTKTATFTVTLSAAQTVPVFFDAATSDGTATAGSDYVAKALTGQRITIGSTSKTFTVTINGDTTAEPDEAFTVNLSNPAGGVTIADGQAVGTITNDDGVSSPTLSIGDVSIAEGNSGTQVATFTVSLSAASASAVTYDIATANGTATAGSDYVASSLVGQSIAAGLTSKTFAVTINGDTAVEADEPFTVNVSNVSGATVADGSATGTITNDDSAGGPTLSIGDVTISEGNSSTKLATFTVTLSAAQTVPVFFDAATANGTATAGSDYVAKTVTSQRIVVGTTTKTVTVTINGDTTSEPDETFLVTLSNPVAATIADGSATGTITNDDAAATPTLSIGDMSIAEGNSGTKVATFTVSLSPAAAGTVSYDIATSNGTATAGSDYVASSLVGQQITAGQTSKTFSVTINGDATVEPDETFTVTLSNVSGATLGDGSAVGMITNDDSAGGGGPTLSIGDVTISEGNSSTKLATFTVTLSAAQTVPVFFDATTSNGTATAGSDYVAKTVTGQRIVIGGTSKTVTVTINGDTTVEPNETFTVTLSNPVAATIADGSALGTISNDDAAALSLARFDAQGLVDDLDDGNKAPQVTKDEYALLLLDTSAKLCQRTNAATIVGIDGVENRNVLADLAETANAMCSTKPRYQAVMADTGTTGFLVEATVATDARGVTVLEAPKFDVTAGVTTLRVQASGHERPLTVLLPSPLPTQATARGAQLKALGQSVNATLKADPQARVVMIGGVTLNPLLDLSLRDLPKLPGQSVPAERILLSPALLHEFGQSKVEFLPQAKTGTPTQVLNLQR